MDIRTLAILLSITNLLQFVALSLQHFINKAYHGSGWWALGFASGALGFALLVLRNSVYASNSSIVATNGFFFLGLIFQYVGVMRFFEKRWNPRPLAAGLILYLAAIAYFTYLKPDFTARGALFSVAVAALSALVAYCFFVHHIPSVRASALFIAALFAIQACFFAFRAVDLLEIAPMMSIFASTPEQVVTFLESYVQGIFFTIGLIFMVNQRLSETSREAKDQFELIFQAGMDASLITRLSDGMLIDANEGFARLSGFTREEAIGHSTVRLNLWQNPADRDRFTAELREKGSCQDFEALFLRKDGSAITGLLSARIVRLQGKPHVITILHDITERKRLEDELRELASLDGLTGVVNRRHFIELAAKALTRAARYRRSLAIVLVDVDSLKPVNDTYGHAVGDQALLHLVQTYRAKLRDTDLFARFGGDEFAVLLPDTTADEAYRIVDRLCADLDAHPFSYEGKQIHVTTSCGVSELADERETLDTLLARADQALYRAKELGRNRVLVWMSPE